MESPTWIDGLRVLVVIGLAWGAYQGIKNRPPAVRHNGKKYYPLPDGRFASAWGIVAKDPVVIAALKAEQARQQSQPPV